MPPLKPLLKIRLVTLLLLTALIALGVSHYQEWHELQRVRAELTALRNNALELDVSDPDKIYAIALPTYGDLQWRWRVQLPEQGRYRLSYSLKQIPESGLPEPSRTLDDTFLDRYAKPIAGGEPFLLSIALFRDQDSGWQLVTGVPGRTTTLPLKNPPAWLDETRRSGWSNKVYGKNATVAVSESDPFPLLRYRRGKEVPGGVTVDMEPTDGLMIWIERTP